LFYLLSFISFVRRYTKALDSIKSLRKDRVADLKAEKERLSSLSLEKSHADKLKSRMSDINSNIATKEIDRNELNERYNAVVASNAKFLETATKFREIFVKVEALGEKKSRYQEELDSARENLQEIQGIQNIRLRTSILMSMM
jgi:DNA repair protein RAD50